MSNPSLSFWLALYLASLEHAERDGQSLYHSRIDGALLPAGPYRIEVSPLYLGSITVVGAPHDL